MCAEAPLVGGRVGPRVVDGGPEIDHRAARRDDRVGDVLRLRMPAALPVVAPGYDAGRAGVDPEVGERDQRRDLQLVVRPREVGPDVLVAVRELRLGAWPARDEVAEVELVAGARRQEDRIADRRVRRVRDDLVGERGGHRGQRRHVLGVRAVERLHRRVDRAHARLGGRDVLVDLGADRRDRRRRDELVDEHRAVGAQRRDQGVGIAGVGEPCDRRHLPAPRGRQTWACWTTSAACSRYRHAISGGRPPQSGMSMSGIPLRTISVASSVL